MGLIVGLRICYPFTVLQVPFTCCPQIRWGGRLESGLTAIGVIMSCSVAAMIAVWRI
jgi:hypothetical protein